MSLIGAVLTVPVRAAGVVTALAVKGAVEGVDETARIASAVGGAAVGALRAGTQAGTATFQRRPLTAELPQSPRASAPSSSPPAEVPHVPGLSSVRETVDRKLQGAARVTESLGALARGRRDRRVWSRAGRAHIQAHGLHGKGEQHQRYAHALTEMLGRIEGVNWAEVNAVTGHILIDFAEGGVDLDSLVDAVEEVEEAHEARRAEEGVHAAPPDDDTAVAAAGLALAADGVGLVAAVLGRLSDLPLLPRPVHAAVTLADTAPRAREALEQRLGPLRADALLALLGATAQGLAQGAVPLAADAAHRTFQLFEVRARREAWNRREQHLVVPGGVGQPQEHAERPERPCPLPDGPVEKAADRTAMGHLLGGVGALVGTRDPAAAAELILATVSKAARHGRESFAAVLGHDLARRGVVVLEPTALRRLDRVSAVVIDSSVLCDGDVRMLSALSTGDALDDAGVWRLATALLERCSMADLSGTGPWPSSTPADAGYGDESGDGGDAHRGSGADGWRLLRAADVPDGSGPADPAGLTLDLIDRHGTICGRVRVGASLDPLAEALLTAAHDAARHVVLTQHASTGELHAWGDESSVRAEELTDHIQALQREGHGVLAIAHDRDQALDAADVGISVLRGTGVADWRADLVCGPGLAEVWRVLSAVPAAHRASERAAQLSFSGSALGALLLVGGPGRRSGGGPLKPLTTWQDLPPAHAASLTAMAANALAARRLQHRPLPRPVVRNAWHALSAEEVYNRLHRSRTEPELVPRTGAAAVLHRIHLAEERFAESPLIRRAVVTPIGATIRLAVAAEHELDDPLTPVLALGAAASAIVGSSVDALLVVGVMAGNAVIGGAQRLRAEQALGDLLLGQQVPARRVCADRAQATPAHPDASAVVEADADARPGPADQAPLAHLREAPTEEVPGDRLRAGDLIAVRANDVVPADARLLLADALEVDEASLTGESVPVEKTPEPTPNADMADRRCMLYEGTTVLAGSGLAVVVATAEATEAGQASTVAGHVQASAGMQARLAELTRIALPATAVGGAAVTALGMLGGLPLRRALDSGVAVAVAAVPEGLPLVATLSQLAAARRLSRLGVLVRSTRALEALGRVDTICFDKTGTLTEGRLHLVRLVGPAAQPLVPGSEEGLTLLRVAARACPPTEADDRHLPHATDRAVLQAAGTDGTGPGWTLEEELPFETSRGYAASLGREGQRVVVEVKGAPEVVLARCVRVQAPGRAQAPRRSAREEQPFTAARRRSAQGTVRTLAKQGLRVLAVAERRVPDTASVRGRVADHVEDLTLLGFIGIADTPRPAAEETVRRLEEAGIRVTMITGDHPTTAAAVAAELGIPHADRVMTGTQMDAMSTAERITAVQQATVFARVSPTQKTRIVKDLQRGGCVVAMTGDGANDAAAIRRADVGIAVAGQGSSSARTAADLVLTAADTSLILDALREGRALWESVRDAAAILVGGNAGEVAFTVLGTALGGRAPLTTRQLLLVNLLTDMLPALAVALTPAERGGDEGDVSLSGAPARGFAGKDMAQVLAVRGGATALAALAAWQLGRLTRLVPGGRRRASTMGLTALVGAQLGQTLLTRWHSPLVLSTCAVSAVALFAVVETPGVSQFFGCTPLGPGAWAIVTGAATAATLGAAVAPGLLWPLPGATADRRTDELWV
ncbi:cation-transporting ATPase I [Streptacidiphilus sp. MAP12-16]|uniref:cation-translocating P-type ATPase n=1 Tax=Streptacidiphilus sp. MAP12-16 TaxID=3156300 RepID=UPI0035173ABD